jgi:hypothetical protein
MNVISESSNFDNMTAEFVAYTSEVTMQFSFDWWMYQRLTIFRAEYDVHIIFY